MQRKLIQPLCTITWILEMDYHIGGNQVLRERLQCMHFFNVDPRNPEGEIPDIFLYYSEEKEKYGLKPGRYNGHDTYAYQKFHSIGDNKVQCIYEFFQLAEPELETWHKGSDLERWKQFSPVSLRDNLRTGESYIDEDSKDTLSYLLDRWSKKVENYELQKMFP